VPVQQASKRPSAQLYQIPGTNQLIPLAGTQFKANFLIRIVQQLNQLLTAYYCEHIKQDCTVKPLIFACPSFCDFHNVNKKEKIEGHRCQYSSILSWQ